jgi:hypothetical protein
VVTGKYLLPLSSDAGMTAAVAGVMMSGIGDLEEAKKLHAKIEQVIEEVVQPN